MIGNDQEARIIAVLGAPGGGKSTFMRKCIAKPKRKRTLIWSPKEQIDRYVDLYPGSVLCTTAEEVRQVLKVAGARGGFHIVFKPALVRKIDEKRFDVVCKMALAVGDMTFIAEELHTVTRPGWAPDGWSQLTTLGRGFGIEIFGLSQRPAIIDNTFLGMCSRVHTRRLSLPVDADNVARAMGVKPAEVAALSGYQWIERNNQTGIVTRG